MSKDKPVALLGLYLGLQTVPIMHVLFTTVCGEKKIRCQGTSHCIDTWEVCDLHEDCEDGSDEASCPKSHCLPGQWQCKNKVCIMEDWKCNGINNCGDSSDEDVCGMLLVTPVVSFLCPNVPRISNLSIII